MSEIHGFNIACTALARCFWMALFFIVIPSRAQEPVFINYTTNNGLPSSEVHSIVQDSTGHLWFATDRGVVEYNGYEFKTYGTQDGLPDISVLDFFPDNQGRVWAYTFGNSLFYFNMRRFDGFHIYEYNHLLPRMMYPKDLCYSNKGTLYVTYHGSGNTGYVTIDSTGNRNFCSDILTKNNRCNIDVIRVDDGEQLFGFISCRKPLGRWVFQTDNVLFQWNWMFDEEEDLLYITKNDTTYILRENQILEKRGGQKKRMNIRLGKLTDDLNWIGTRGGGLEILNKKGEKINQLLDGYSVSYCYMDHQGNLWVATLHSGIFCIKSFEITLNSNVRASKILKLDRYKEKLLISFPNGTMDIIDSKGVQSSIVIQKGGIPRNVFVSKKTGIMYWQTDTLYRSYNLNTNMFEDVNRRTKGHINKVSEQEDPSLFSTTSGVLFCRSLSKWDMEFYRYDLRVTDACIWKGEIYMGTRKGVYKASLNHSETANQIQTTDSLLSCRISDVDVLGDYLVFGTIGNGMLFFDGDNSWRVDGITNNIVNEVVIENDSVLWACTNGGLFRVQSTNDYKHFSINSVSYKDGLPSNEIIDVDVLDDTVWIATSKGLARFPKSYWSYHTEGRNRYLKITEVLINDSLVEEIPDSIFKLSYKENRVEFKFEQIDYKNKNPLYYYSLVSIGDNPDWRKTTNRNIIYSTLNPGTYEFTLEASDKNGLPSGQQLKRIIFISEAWYNTWWFYGAIFLFMISSVYAGFKWRVLLFNPIVLDEFVRVITGKLRPKENYAIFKEQGVEKRIRSEKVLFMKSSGNYVDVITDDQTHTIRSKIGDILEMFPDSVEYARVHRSYIVRIDKIDGKSKKSVVVAGHEIPVSPSYHDQLDRITL